jgi:pimeloyl-ACP methyl ester carboxylesterase
MKPTVVLVHGAYADSSSWNGVREPLLAAGHRVITFVGISHPAETAQIILQAAGSRALADA